jgi:hypothetical protein
LVNAFEALMLYVLRGMREDQRHSSIGLGDISTVYNPKDQKACVTIEEIVGLDTFRLKHVEPAACESYIRSAFLQIRSRSHGIDPIIPMRRF